MATKMWTQQEEDRVRDERQQGASVADIAASLGRSEASISGKLRDLKDKGELPWTDQQGREINTAKNQGDLREASHEFENVALKAEIKDLEVKISDFKTGVTVEPEWDDEWIGPKEWEKAEVDGRKRIDKAIKQGRFKVDFEKGPVAICAISDQHIAKGTPCDFARMREDAELIRDTEGFYAVLGGDGVDNHIKHRAAMISARSNPDDQWRLFDHYLQLFGDSKHNESKILAVISGNHDAWTKEMSGVDYLSSVVANNKLCYAPAEARLDITVEGQPYKMVMRHQTGRFNSSLNQTHAVKRFYEYNDETFDIGVIGHHHEAAIEMFIRHGLKRYAARPGSYQITSPYAHQYGFGRSIPTCPTFVLFPGERRMIGFADVRDAVWAWGNVTGK